MASESYLIEKVSEVQAALPSSSHRTKQQQLVAVFSGHFIAANRTSEASDEDKAHAKELLIAHHPEFAHMQRLSAKAKASSFGTTTFELELTGIPTPHTVHTVHTCPHTCPHACASPTTTLPHRHTYSHTPLHTSTLLPYLCLRRLLGIHQLVTKIVNSITNILLGGNSDWDWLKNVIQTFFANFGIDSFKFAFQSEDGGYDIKLGALTAS